METQEMVTLDWARMSAADKSVLKLLGFTEPEQKVVKVRQAKTTTKATSCPPEYFAIRNFVCECCGTVTTLHGKMAQVKVTDDYLRFVSEDIAADVPKQEIKIVTSVTITCKHCDETLNKMDKSALIRMVKNLHEIAARRAAM